MYQYRLYKEEEIEALRKEKNKYKHLYFQQQQNSHSVNTKETYFEQLEWIKGEMSVMDEKIKSLTDQEEQIHLLKTSINELQNDITQIKKEVTNTNIPELYDKLNDVVTSTAAKVNEVKQEVQLQQKRVMQMQTTKQAYRSEYRQLQSIIGNVQNSTTTTQQRYRNTPENLLLQRQRFEGSKNIIIKPRKREKQFVNNTEPMIETKINHTLPLEQQPFQKKEHEHKLVIEEEKSSKLQANQIKNDQVNEQNKADIQIPEPNTDIESTTTQNEWKASVEHSNKEVEQSTEEVGVHTEETIQEKEKPLSRWQKTVLFAKSFWKKG
ncbi:hypothetical protein ACFOZ1_10840 [Gracilibacillus marinus]|jgi:hypothetical protein|uniref:Uncharacterized protein n=1 Tax=Gracilibacillus marinus TaxID=630535 RepID=A0ABV8VUV9_9BACI